MLAACDLDGAHHSGAARIRAAERAYFANYRQRWPDYSPVGRAEWNHRMVNNMKRRKQKANTSKAASSPPLNAPAQALSGVAPASTPPPSCSTGKSWLHFWPPPPP